MSRNYRETALELAWQFHNAFDDVPEADQQDALNYLAWNWSHAQGYQHIEVPQLPVCSKCIRDFCQTVINDLSTRRVA